MIYKFKAVGCLLVLLRRLVGGEVAVIPFRPLLAHILILSAIDLVDVTGGVYLKSYGCNYLLVYIALFLRVSEPGFLLIS